MNKTDRRRVSGPLIWAALLIAVAVPITAAAFSPLLAWREPIYIIAGFAGILGMGLLLFQPILAGGYIPELSTRSHRRLHRWVGSTLVLAVVVHVGGSGSRARRTCWTPFCFARQRPSPSGA